MKGDIIVANIFSGLEEFGLGNLSGMNIYEDKAKEAEKVANADKKPTITEEDIIFDKTYKCPVCDSEFKSKMVKSGKVKLHSLDMDLRPRYLLVDPLKYDAIVCPHCGYAALNRFFSYVTGAQATLIKNNISVAFRGLKESGVILSYDEAIARHKLSLVNSIVKKSKTSERAYTCLKTAWLIRGKAESLPEDTANYKQEIDKLNQEELEFITKAYDGFEEGFSKETFPMCGMDENTVAILVAELARRVGKFDESSRWVSRVLIARDSSDRLKEKAREIKNLLTQK